MSSVRTTRMVRNGGRIEHVYGYKPTPSPLTVAVPLVMGLSPTPSTTKATLYGFSHHLQYCMQTLLALVSAGGLLWHFWLVLSGRHTHCPKVFVPMPGSQDDGAGAASDSPKLAFMAILFVHATSNNRLVVMSSKANYTDYCCTKRRGCSHLHEAVALSAATQNPLSPRVQGASGWSGLR